MPFAELLGAEFQRYSASSSSSALAWFRSTVLKRSMNQLLDLDKRARLVGVEVPHQLHRALEVGEQRGHRFASPSTERSASAPSAKVRIAAVFENTSADDSGVERSPMAVPQSGQNLAVAGMSAPHFEQRIGSGPHSAQNRLPGQALDFTI
jgi:hypothetical protein